MSDGDSAECVTFVRKGELICSRRVVMPLGINLGGGGGGVLSGKIAECILTRKPIQRVMHVREISPVGGVKFRLGTSIFRISKYRVALRVGVE